MLVLYSDYTLVMNEIVYLFIHNYIYISFISLIKENVADIATRS